MKISPHASFLRWQIFLVTWLAYAGYYLTRNAFSVAKIGMAQDNVLNKSQISQIEASYLLAYAIGQFILGIYGDRLGTRKIVLAGMFFSVLFCFFMGFSSIFLLFLILFSLQGFCQATGWAPLSKNLSYWFSTKERGTIMGLWSTNYTIGGLIAAPFAGFCCEYFKNWRYGFFFPSIALFIVLILFFLFQINRPEDADLLKENQNNTVEETEETTSWKEIFDVLKSPIVLTLGIVYFCLKPTRYAILFWGPWYINEKLGTGMTESSLISVCFGLGGFFGVILSGYLSDRFFQSRRIPISIISLSIVALILYYFDSLISLQSKSLTMLLLTSIGFFLYAPDSLVSGVAAVDFGTKKGASTSAGFINGCGSIGAILGGSLPGIVSEKWGWHCLFLSFSLAIVVGILLLLPRWNCLPKKD